MEHRTLDDIQRTARIVPIGTAKMSRRARLERWAELLERDPQQRLTPLRRMEFLSAQELMGLRDDDTPLTVAFRDPVLRKAGLASDRLADAIEFFDLGVGEAHYLLCDCHYMGAMNATGVASRIRSVASRVTFRELWNRIRGMGTARHFV